MPIMHPLQQSVNRMSREDNKNCLVGVFYQPRPEDKEKLIWIQKLYTILSAITTT